MISKNTQDSWAYIKQNKVESSRCVVCSKKGKGTYFVFRKIRIAKNINLVNLYRNHHLTSTSSTYSLDYLKKSILTPLADIYLDIPAVESLLRTNVLNDVTAAPFSVGFYSWQLRKKTLFLVQLKQIFVSFFILPALVP